jgi:hypothetical protein
MTLKEIGRFQFCKDTYIILESKERFNKETWWNYYITIKGCGNIHHVIGEKNRSTFEEMKEYLFNTDFLSYAKVNLDGGVFVFDLLCLISDSINVNLWRNGEIVASYDGKNSIDDKWNGQEVIGVYSSCENTIDIIVSEVWI